MPEPLDHSLETLRAPESDPGWIEVWDNWFVIPEQGIGGYVRLTIRPHDGVSWYWASLLGFDDRLVTVLVDDAPLPRRGSMELRNPGLWTETTVLRPFEHLTTDIEAFGVAVDSPTDVWEGAWGERTAVGFELDWDTDGGPGPAPVPGTDGYRLVGKAHGEVLLGTSRYEIEGVGVRDHWWGVPEQTDRWRGWASRDGALVHSEAGPLDLDLDRIVAELPVGEVRPGLSIVGWAPAIGGDERHARALVVDDRGGGWIEIVRSP
ncbi:MAG: hypothetical protein ACR2P0_18075 [Acidimicrobiales bacterium]